MRLDRPIGALLLLWPCLWALWIAGEGRPEPSIVAVFVVGVFVMRSAGCVINDFADRDIDPHVERTRNRPLAAGRVRPDEAVWLFVILCLLAFGLVLTQNTLTVILSVPAVVLAASYPYVKRIHHVPQAHLGAAFGWAVPMAFAALTDTVPPVGWVLFTVALIWAIAYDTIYAMVDRDDDLSLGVKSTAILFGPFDRVAVGAAQCAVLVGLLLVGFAGGFGPIYFVGLGIGAGFFIYQQRLIRHRERASCFRAFLNNNWFGAAVFLGVAADSLFAG